MNQETNENSWSSQTQWEDIDKPIQDTENKTQKTQWLTDELWQKVEILGEQLQQIRQSDKLSQIQQNVADLRQGARAHKTKNPNEDTESQTLGTDEESQKVDETENDTTS